jgi:patatin-like phospholipase/acyl hydrolase
MYGKCGFHCTLHRVIRILTLCSARATSAAPSFFRPANVAQYGAFQDGGLRYNNPVNLAIWESRQIWPTHNSPDFVLSLGTGQQKLRRRKLLNQDTFFKTASSPVFADLSCLH